MWRGFWKKRLLTGGGKMRKLKHVIGKVYITKTMNRRVRRTIRPREPQLVKRGTEGPAEDGLGVA